MAYLPGSPEALSPVLRRFSIVPSTYQPFCRPCHVALAMFAGLGSRLLAVGLQRGTGFVLPFDETAGGAT